MTVLAREELRVERDELARDLADDLAADLGAAVAERGEASLVVSGGSTPKPLFDELSRRRLPWEHVLATLADERWVPPDHPDSNERMVRERLLQDRARRALFFGLKNDAPTPEAGRERCEQTLAALSRPFDVVILGMGTDGHTASLFPGAPELAAGLDLDTPHACVAVHPPGAAHPRMSLTLRTLLDSRRIVLHATGEEKWQVLERALEDGPVAELPIRAVIREAADRFELWWAP